MLKKKVLLLLIITFCTVLTACGTEYVDHEEELSKRYSAGYDDGYYDGYNDGHDYGYNEGKDVMYDSITCDPSSYLDMDYLLDEYASDFDILTLDEVCEDISDEDYDKLKDILIKYYPYYFEEYTIIKH